MNKFLPNFNKLILRFKIINVVTLIISIIWLLFLNEWNLIYTGIITSFTSYFILQLIFFASTFIFIIPATYFEKRENRFGFYFFGFLNVFFTTFIVLIWCLAIIFYFVKESTISNIIPVILFSYNVAINPIAFLANKDLKLGNESAMITTFFAGIAFIISMFIIIFFPANQKLITIVFSSILFVGIVFEYLMYLFKYR